PVGPVSERAGTIHEAARGFEHAPRPYEIGRPPYPAEAIERLVTELGIEDGKRVLDLAAGTGKLTRLLVPTGAFVVAVEPVEAMRAALTRSLPEVQALAGTAEAIPLPAASIDAVAVGQAFHWFDGDAPRVASGAWKDAFARTTLFTPLQRARFSFVHEADFAAVVARVTSVSFIAALPPAEFARVVDQVRKLLATHPETKGRSAFELPYRTGVYWCERL